MLSWFCLGPSSMYSVLLGCYLYSGEPFLPSGSMAVGSPTLLPYLSVISVQRESFLPHIAVEARDWVICPCLMVPSRIWDGIRKLVSLISGLTS